MNKDSKEPYLGQQKEMSGAKLYKLEGIKMIKDKK